MNSEKYFSDISVQDAKKPGPANSRENSISFLQERAHNRQIISPAYAGAESEEKYAESDQPVLRSRRDGYRIRVTPPEILNAVDYGVPQYRERLFLAGNRNGAVLKYPEPCDKKDRRTVRDAIGHLPAPEPPSDTAIRVAKTIRKRREKYGF